jgi:hypothetical protein
MAERGVAVSLVCGEGRAIGRSSNTPCGESGRIHLASAPLFITSLMRCLRHRRTAVLLWRTAASTRRLDSKNWCTPSSEHGARLQERPEIKNAQAAKGQFHPHSSASTRRVAVVLGVQRACGKRFAGMLATDTRTGAYMRDSPPIALPEPHTSPPCVSTTSS